MTVTTQEPSITKTEPKDFVSRLLVREFWGAVSIVAMWLAVLFDGVFGANMTFTNSPTQVTTIPSVIVVAIFAVAGTVAVAKRTFR
jgi:hypothetical protein